MLLPLLRLKASHVKLMSAGLMLAILGSWTLLVTQSLAISRVEANIVIMLANILAWPAMVALYSPNAIAGEGIGIVATYIGCLWSSIGRLAFWTVWHKRLPLLGTRDLGFSFGPVPMDRRFQNSSLGFAAFNTVLCIGWTWPWFLVIRASISLWWNGDSGDKHTDSFSQLRPWMKWVMGVFAVFGVLSSIVLVAAVEMTIIYNDLKPITDLTQPGQSVPLVIGAITLVDGLFAAVRPVREKGLESTRTENFML